MLIDGDYFKNIDIMDDDITADDINDDVMEYTDTKSLFTHLFSKYTHYMSVTTSMEYPCKNKEKWDNISHLIRRLNYMFDIYGITHSEPVFVSSKDWKKDLPLLKDSDSYEITEFNNYKIISKIDSAKEPYDRNNDIKMIVFIDLPEFMTMRKGYMFICNTIKCVWKSLAEVSYYRSVKIITNDFYKVLDINHCDIKRILNLDEDIFGFIILSLKRLVPVCSREIYTIKQKELYYIIKEKYEEYKNT